MHYQITVWKGKERIGIYGNFKTKNEALLFYRVNCEKKGTAFEIQLIRTY